MRTRTVSHAKPYAFACERVRFRVRNRARSRAGPSMVAARCKSYAPRAPCGRPTRAICDALRPRTVSRANAY
eukprot:6354081-Lingulodinium_polyedra.AAC.1